MYVCMYVCMYMYVFKYICTYVYVLCICNVYIRTCMYGVWYVRVVRLLGRLVDGGGGDCFS